MTDCSEDQIRDLLPDVITGNLSAHDAAIVDAHVAQCAACAEDLALLKAVYRARPVAVDINVGAIVSRIVEAQAEQPHTVVDSSVRSISSAPSKRNAARFGSWRWAATIAVIAAGGISIAIARTGGVGMMPIAPVDSLLQRNASKSAPITVAVNAPDSSTPKRGTSSTERAALSVGELSDLSDSELADVLNKLESWDGNASSDPLIPVPLLKPAGGTP